jgi:exosortase/archaeosortase family protein
MIPFTIFKNGVRILTLSLLAIYVDTKFITDSWLHHTGGFVFYLPALGMLGLLLWWFRKSERKDRLTQSPQSSQRKAGD